MNQEFKKPRNKPPKRKAKYAKKSSNKNVSQRIEEEVASREKGPDQPIRLPKRKKHPPPKDKRTKPAVAKFGVSHIAHDLTVDDIIKLFPKITSMTKKQQEKIFNSLRAVATADKHALQDEVEQRIKREAMEDTVEYPSYSDRYGHEETRTLQYHALKDSWARSELANTAREDLPVPAAIEDEMEKPFRGAVPTQEAMAQILRRQIADASYTEDPKDALASAKFVVKTYSDYQNMVNARMDKKESDKKPTSATQVNVNINPNRELTPQNHASYADQVRQTFKNNIDAKPHFDSNEDTVIDNTQRAQSFIDNIVDDEDLNEDVDTGHDNDKPLTGG